MNIMTATKLQVRVKKKGKWENWEDVRYVTFKEITSGFDVGVTGAVQYRILNIPVPDLQVHVASDPEITWHDVVFVDGILELPGCAYTRKIRVKPPEPEFVPSWYKTQEGADIIFRFFEKAPRDPVWARTTIVPV